jgi:hypothetical protein
MDWQGENHGYAPAGTPVTGRVWPTRCARLPESRRAPGKKAPGLGDTCVFRKLSHAGSVDAAEALDRAQRAAQQWLLYFTLHATKRMQERLATHADVRHAVITADLAVVSDDGPNRWVLCGGHDLDDCGLRVVVAIDDGTVTVAIVTVYPP